MRFVHLIYIPHEGELNSAQSQVELNRRRYLGDFASTLLSDI